MRPYAPAIPGWNDPAPSPVTESAGGRTGWLAASFCPKDELREWDP